MSTDGVLTESSTSKADATPSASSSRSRMSRRYGTRCDLVAYWNVTLDSHTRVPDYNDDGKTENTRAAYPVDFIENAVIPGIGGHPKNVVFLTADAFGVLPPIAKLTLEQAMYHFLSGYTAKVAGTEAGV